MTISTYLLTSAQFACLIADQIIMYNYYDTPAGMLVVYSTKKGIFKAVFHDVSTSIPHQYVKQKNMPADLVLVGTDFQHQVWKATLAIPSGATMSYQQIAQSIGSSPRAVAKALASNKIAYLVPCHRVIAKSGAISGYAWGVSKKQALLASESGRHGVNK